MNNKKEITIKITDTKENELKFIDILEFIYKIYPLVLIFFLLLDLGTFIGIFNAELGYFNTIVLSNSNNSISLSIVFVYILIPIALIGIFIFSGIFSLYLASFFSNIIIIRNNLILKIECIKIELSILTIVGSLILFFKYVFPLANEFLVNKYSFIISYCVILLILIVLNSIILFLRLNLGKTNFFKDYINPIDLSIAPIVAFLVYIDTITGEYIFVSIIYLTFYLISMFFYTLFFSSSNDDSNEQLNIQKKIYNFFKIKYLIIFLAIFFLFNYFHYQNISYWEKPLKMDNQKEIFGNFTLNLIFNKGMLINNKNNVDFEIPVNYFNNLKEDDEVRIYLEELEQTYNKNKKITLINDCKYLELNSNLKMYFKPIKGNKIIIFLVEEKKFTNSGESSLSLLMLSSYNTSV